MDLQYFTGQEKEKGIFYAVPKILFMNEEFRKLTLKSKMVYSLLLDRVDLSKKNGWKKNGYIYIMYSQKKLAEKLGLSERTIRTSFKELTSKNLISCQKRGLGGAQEILVKNIATITHNENDYQTDKCYTPSHDSSNTTQTKRIKELEAEVEMLKSQIMEMEEENFTLQTGNNFPSKTENISDLDRKNLPSSNTNPNKTNVINTKSIFQGKTEKKKENNKITNIKKSSQQITEEVKTEINQQKTLPYEYVNDARKMEQALKEVSLYESNKELSKGGEGFYFKGLKLFISTLTQMLTNKEPLIIKGEEVDKMMIYDKVVDDLCYNYKNILCLDTIVWNSIDAYEDASKKQQIKSPIKYMTTCIWSVLQNEYITQNYDYDYA